MPIQLQCPHCNKSLKVPDHLAGKAGKCPGCQKTIRVGSAPERESAEAFWPPSGATAKASSPNGALEQIAPQSEAVPNVESAKYLFWLWTSDSPAGPFDANEVHAKLAAGEISWQTRACPLGSSAWRSLGETPGFCAETPAELSDLPGIVSPGFGRHQKSSGKCCRVWAPLAIALWGVLFTPMWAGVMAAINGARLKSSVGVWIPLAIGFGYLGLDMLASAFVTDSYVLSLGLYLGAISALWLLVLKTQRDSIGQAVPASSHASWFWPIVAGSPLALLSIFAFVLAPFVPLEPRQVCEQFQKANSAREAEKYVTANLVPALAALNTAFSQTENPNQRFELTDEAPAPEDVGGYLVGFRFVNLNPGDQVRKISGVFHLISRSDEWKIEDMYIMEVNDQPLERWSAFSKDYTWMAASNRSNAPHAVAQDGKSTPLANGTPQKQKPWYHWLYPLRFSGIVLGKAIFAGIVSVCAAIAATYKKVFSPSPTP